MATYIPQKAEDAASVDGDLGVPILGIRNDAAASRIGSDFDYGFIALDIAGRVGICDLGGSISIDDNAGSITVDGSVSITGSVAVTGPLTNAELRAAPVPVSAASLPLPSGAATEATLATRASEATLATRASEATLATLLTDTQLRATPVPVSGPLTDTQLRASAVPVSGPLTDTQLRASAVPVSAASLPLPTGAATETTLAAVNTKLDTIDDWDETDRAKVNPIVGQAGVQGDAGTVTANTQRVAIATNANTVTEAALIADNAGFTPDTSKVLPVGFVFDDTAGAALAENDIAAARVDAKRAQVMVIEDGATRGNKASVSLGGNLAVNIGAVAGTAPSLAGMINVHGTAASGASATGNPVSVGGLAATSLPTAVSNAQMVRAMSDVFGRQVVIPQAPRDLVDDEILTITASTAVTSFTKSTSSTFYDITSIVIENKSTTGTEVILYDNDGTTERVRFYVPATDTRGVVYQVPLKAAGSGVVWKAKTVTSVTSVYITLNYVKNK